VSIVLGGVSSQPLRASAAEQVAEGAPAGEETWREVARVAAEGVDPPSDLNGDADYRRDLVGTLTQRAFLEALGTGPDA
jgi:carbon-monoxide dehydrogenase medium subunit